MSDADAMNVMAGFGIVAIVIAVVFLLVFLVIAILFLRTLYRCSEALQPANRALPSGLIWLSLIPGLSLIWNVVVVVTLSSGLKKEDAARGTQNFGDGGLVLGLLYSLSPFVMWIPILNVIFALATLVIWILYWNKMSGFTKVLKGTAPAPVVAVPTPPARPAAAPVPPPVAAPLPPVPSPSVAAPVPPAIPVAPVSPPPVVDAPIEATMLSKPAAAPVPAADATLVFAPPPKARLEGLLGPTAGQSFPIPDHGAFMGRAANADLVIGDAQVSGRHAWIGFVDGKLVLRDQGSTNGTFLNDDLRQPVAEIALKAGDVIVLGRQASVKLMVAVD